MKCQRDGCNKNAILKCQWVDQFFYAHDIWLCAEHIRGRYCPECGKQYLDMR